MKKGKLRKAAPGKMAAEIPPVVFAMRETAISNLRKAGWSDAQISEMEITRIVPAVTPQPPGIKLVDRKNARVSLDILKLSFECEASCARNDLGGVAASCIGMGLMAAVVFGKSAEFKLHSLGAATSNAPKINKTSVFMGKAREIYEGTLREGITPPPNGKQIYAMTTECLPEDQWIKAVTFYRYATWLPKKKSTR